MTSTESERGASGWVFWVLIWYAITSFYVQYLGRPGVDVLLGKHGGVLDMYALLPGFSRYPKLNRTYRIRLLRFNLPYIYPG